MAVLIVRTQYISARSKRKGAGTAKDPKDPSAKASRSLRYAMFGSKDVEHPEDKGKAIFDAHSDQADIKAFERRLTDPLTRHPMAPKVHQVIFSLKRADFDRAGMRDWTVVVREVLAEYELKTGRKLDWIASHHDNRNSPHSRDHPHVHIYVKAVYETSGGQRRQLRIYRHDLAQIRESAAGRLEARGLQIDRGRPQRPSQFRSGRSGRTHGTLNAVTTLLDQIRRRMNREHAEREWLEEQERNRQDRGR